MRPVIVGAVAAAVFTGALVAFLSAANFWAVVLVVAVLAFLVWAFATDDTDPHRPKGYRPGDHVREAQRRAAAKTVCGVYRRDGAATTCVLHAGHRGVHEDHRGHMWFGKLEFGQAER